MTSKSRQLAQRSRLYDLLLMALLKVLSSLQLTVVVAHDEVRIDVCSLQAPVVREQLPSQSPQ